MTASYNLYPSRKALFLYSTRFLLIWGLITIVWGAYVRISGSGDGCGEHWPLCKGRIIPELLSGGMLETWIEFIHRAKSGIFGLFALLLFTASFYIFSKGSTVRKATSYLLFFTIIEALLGAGLVLLKLVDTNQSYLRLVVMSVHLINTFALMGSIIAIEACIVNDAIRTSKNLYLSLIGLLIILLAMTGAWASLSSTLSPSASIAVGVAQDISADTPLLLKLRIVHPLFAIIAGVLLIYLTGAARIEKQSLKLLICVQIIIGLSTLLFLSPVWIKLLHLLIAELTWIFYQRLYWGLDH